MENSINLSSAKLSQRVVNVKGLLWHQKVWSHIFVSKLNHLFMALPNPSEETINNLSKKFFSFIWQSGLESF